MFLQNSDGGPESLDTSDMMILQRSSVLKCVLYERPRSRCKFPLEASKRMCKAGARAMPKAKRGIHREFRGAPSYDGELLTGEAAPLRVRLENRANHDRSRYLNHRDARKQGQSDEAETN